MAELDLNVGSNTLTVTVTAEDGTTEQEYTITVTRAGATTADVVWSTTMTVGETTGLGRGYRSSGEVRPGGSLVTDSFTTGGVPYTVLRLEVSDHQSAVEFKLNSELPSYADLTLEFAGETLPLASSTSTTSANNTRFTFSDAWLAANAPSLSFANFETTLAVDAMVSACLRTAAQVCPGGGTTTSSSDASLSALALAERGGDTISLGETFVPATLTYTASVANEIDTVTLTATKNDSNATVVITDDDDTNTPGVAELDLNVGSNTLTVTVTAQGRHHRAGIHDYGHAGGGANHHPGLVHDHDGGGSLTGRQGVLF